MTKVLSKSLPHAISSADIGDPTLRNKVMLLQENIRSLASQLAEAQKALVELQGGNGGTSVSSLAEKVAPIVESSVSSASELASVSAASADASAVSAASSKDIAVEAKNTAVTAKGDAVSAKDSACQYASDAVSAKESAEAARDAAQTAASSIVWSTSLTFLYQSFGAARTVLMEAIVPDTSKTYTVNVLFRNTTATSRACKVNGEACTVAATAGATSSKTLTEVPGDGSFNFVNVTNSVDVFIFIKQET